MLGVLPNVTHQAVLLASQVGGTFCLQKEGKKKQKKKKKRKSGNKAFFDDERRRRGLILRVTTEMEHKKSADAVAGANITAKLRRKDECDKTVDDDDVVRQKKKKKKKQEEQKQKQNKGELPDELWDKILKSVDDNSVAAFANVSKKLRRVQKASGRKLKVNLKGYNKDVHTSGDMGLVSEGWCLWVMSLSAATKEKEKMKRIMNAAALNGHLNVLKHWKDPELIGQKIIFFWILFDEHTCAFAAYGGYLEVLIWLRENNCPWNSETCSSAALGGHLDVLKYLHEKGCPWNSTTCECAAMGGHLEVLKYAHEQGCPWDFKTCAGAASRGHLDVLKYLHEKGCPWNELTCAFAAIGGHLDVLKYLHEKGCPWNLRDCIQDALALGKSPEVLKYLREILESE